MYLWQAKVHKYHIYYMTIVRVLVSKKAITPLSDTQWRYESSF